MGSLSLSGDDAGMVLRATSAILRALSIVPKAKYCLSVAYCGLSVGHDAQLLDLLAPSPAAAAVSLRDGSAAAALAGLTCWSVEDPVDVLEVRLCVVCAVCIQEGVVACLVGCRSEADDHSRHVAFEKVHTFNSKSTPARTVS